jgi:hypothetical protein
MEVKLTTPIQVRGEETSVIELRAPKISEIRSMGLPYRINDDGLVLDAKMCGRYMTLLSGLPKVYLDEMSAADFTAACFAIAGFFEQKTPQESSTAKSET